MNQTPIDRHRESVVGMQDFDHKHVVVSATIAKPPRTVGEVETWLEDVVKAADMKILMDAKAIRCDTPGNEGVTGTVVIETSHASIHVWESAPVPFLRFDLYSCKRFDPWIVVECLKRFDPYYIRFTLIDRNDSNKIIDEQDIQVMKIEDLSEADQVDFESKYSIKTADRTVATDSSLGGVRFIAATRGLAFDLDSDWFDQAVEDAKKTWPKIVSSGSDDSFWKAAVDRKNPSLGYTKDNCHIIPHALSLAKWKWHASELNTLAQLLIDEVGLNKGE